MTNVVSINHYLERREDKARLDAADALICAGLQMLGAEVAIVSFIKAGGLPGRLRVQIPSNSAFVRHLQQAALGMH